jgi:hypothetical protein
MQMIYLGVSWENGKEEAQPHLRSTIHKVQVGSHTTLTIIILPLASMHAIRHNYLILVVSLIVYWTDNIFRSNHLQRSWTLPYNTHPWITSDAYSPRSLASAKENGRHVKGACPAETTTQRRHVVFLLETLTLLCLLNLVKEELHDFWKKHHDHPKNGLGSLAMESSFFLSENLISKF